MNEFPNVGEKEFEEGARRHMRRMLNLDAFAHDWDADRESLKKMRDMLDGTDAGDVANTLGLDEDEFVAVIESGDVSDEFIAEHAEMIRAIGGELSQSPMIGHDEMGYGIDVTHTVSVQFAGGGPTSWLNFTLDKDGDLVRADMTYSWGSRSATLDLTDEQAEYYWARLGMDASQIVPQDRKADRPGLRM